MPRLMNLLTKLRAKYQRNPQPKLQDYDYDDPYLSNLTWSLDLTDKSKDSNITKVKQNNKGSK